MFSRKEIDSSLYPLIERLKTYRSGKKIGSNSALMIMMAKTLTDEEIANLAEYLKDAKYENK